jgi:zinc protease
MIRFITTFFAALLTAGWAVAAVEIQEVETPGGFKAWLVEEHSIPFAAIEIRFRGGTSLDADGKRGAVNLMTGLLEEGAGDLDAQAFAEARESLATSIRFDSHSDALTVSFRFLSENRDEAVELLRLAMNEPTFGDEAVERVRAQVLSGLRHNVTDPNEIARARFNELAWGPHPYGSNGEGSLESVAALTRQDLLDAHAGAMARDRVYVGAVGDITAEELSEVLDLLLGALPAEGAPLPTAASYAMPSGVTLVDFETPQSVAIFGHEGIDRDDPDFFPAFILNEVFGGSGFESRLMREVRVKRGLTYGIGSYLSPRDHGALTLGQVATVGNRMSETVEVVREEWARIAQGVTEEELEAAKLYLTGAYPLRFDGNAPIARIMVGMQMDDLPVEYIATRNDNVNAVTLDDITRVAERIFRPDDLHFVIVGQSDDVALD